MLSLFRRTPKWQSPKSATRIEALAELKLSNPEEAAILLSLARGDESHEVRQQAVSYLDDLDTVNQLHKRDAHEAVRTAASVRLHALLAGKNTPAISLTDRLSFLERVSDSELLNAIVQDADTTEIRLAALGQIKDEGLLSNIVKESNVARIRQTAAEGIISAEYLEPLSKLMQSKDKTVYRILRGRLDELNQREKAVKQLHDKQLGLCDAMESHARAAFNPLYAAKAESLLQQWQELNSHAADSASSERFETAYGIALAQIEELQTAAQQSADKAQAQKEQVLCVTTLESSLEQYQGQDDFDLPALSALHKTQQLRWELATQLVTPSSSLTEKYTALIHHLEKLIQHLQQWQQDRPVVEASLLQIADANDESRAATLPVLRDIQLRYQSTGFPLPLLLMNISGLETPQLAIKKIANIAQKEEKAALQVLLDNVAKEIKAGNSKQASKHLKKARDYSKEHQVHHPRFTELAEQLRELQSWAGFAVQPKKEALVEQMRALITHEMDPDDKADAIHALQEEWKVLGTSNATIEQPLWEQFKAAADEAFEPCRLHFAAQRELRHQNLEKRQALCEQLQAYLSNLPASPDWKTHDAILRTAREEWQRYNPSDRHQTQALYQQFQATLKALEAPLNAARQQNESAKRLLIARVVALQQEQNTRQACDTARQLQQEWKVIGQAHHKVDRQLWQDFRAACDAVFQKRDAEFQSQKSEREAQVKLAEECIAAMETLSAEDMAILRQEADMLEERFRTLNLPRDHANALRQRFQTARKAIDKTLHDHQAAARREKQNTIISAWQALEIEESEATKTQILTQLLDLEILLEIPSPEAWQTQRRERQMQQLQERGLRKLSYKEAQALIDELFKTPAPASIRAECSQRLQKILEKNH